MKDLNKLCLYLYGSYAASVFLQIHPYTVALAIIAVMVALVIAYRARKESAGTHYESHFDWIIRTFWIGTGVYMPVLLLILTIAFFMNIDMAPFRAAIEDNPALSQEEMWTLTGEQNLSLFNKMAIILFVIFSLWWLWRCWVGYDALKDGKAVRNVKSWL